MTHRTLSARTRRLVIAALVAIASLPARAAIIDVPLVPTSTRIGYTALVFGLFPIPANFERFSGSIKADPADPKACEIHIQVEIASLKMVDPAKTAQALGPSLLDASHYPTMRFDGNCDPAGGVSGHLLLHGVSRALHLSEHRDGDVILSTGKVERRDYGISGFAGLLGQSITIRFSTRLPKGSRKLRAPSRQRKASRTQSPKSAFLTDLNVS